ncbi:MAG: hypothetical protein JW900_13135 [Anaerolineae bacterium]|nr:hypothetical protein [Anaerolineae bacterium]
MESQPTSTQDGIYCSACGHFNPSWRSECEQCQTKLVSPGKPAYSPSYDRPGCVTAYAVILAIAAGLMVVGGLIGGIVMMSEEGGVLGLVVIVVALGIAVLYFLLARGLWRLKNWARVVIIVLQSLGIVSGLLQIIGLLSVSSSPYGSQVDPTGAICGGLVGLGLGAYIIYWFASHGEYFS